MTDLPWLSLRVRDDLLTRGTRAQIVEVLDIDGEVIGRLAGVSGTNTSLRPLDTGQLTVTLDCVSVVESYRPARRT